MADTPKPALPLVELRCAFVWTCPGCKHEQPHNGKRLTGDHADDLRAGVAERLSEMLGEEVDPEDLEGDDMADCVTRPDTVFCRQCENQYQTKPFPGEPGSE